MSVQEDPNPFLFSNQISVWYLSDANIFTHYGLKTFISHQGWILTTLPKQRLILLPVTSEGIELLDTWAKFGKYSSIHTNGFCMKKILGPPLKLLHVLLARVKFPYLLGGRTNHDSKMKDSWWSWISEKEYICDLLVTSILQSNLIESVVKK